MGIIINKDATLDSLNFANDQVVMEQVKKDLEFMKITI